MEVPVLRDGVGGLTPLDLSLWAADFLTGMNPERSDLDGLGRVNGADLSIWAAAYCGGRNSEPIGDLRP